MELYKGYELVIGLEIHLELATRTKIFCGCPTTFGTAPNTQCCPVCMGYPGALPVLNARAVELAVTAGLATHCRIARHSKMDRKHYFYPDLPKAYQISQWDQPLCTDGYLEIDSDVDPTGTKRIAITRIHLEEDAGKLIHGDGVTFIDYNRCGVPLIEVVTAADIRSSQEAVNFVQKLRTIALYTGISDGKMNEGSLRCDVNLSVRKPGTPLGTRTEMKNLNSFTFMSKAIEYEYKRQVDALEAGKSILQETRRYVEATHETCSMRTKEDAADYRYFPEPDLPPFEVSDGLIDRLQRLLPELPDEKQNRYVREFGLTAADARQLTASKELADYFEACAHATRAPKLAANLLLTDVLGQLTPAQADIPIPPAHLAELADLLSEQVINSTTGKKVLKLIWNTGKLPRDVVREKNLAQLNDETALRQVVFAVVAANQPSVEDYRKGRLAAMQFLVGKAMAQTAGKANPVLIQKIMNEVLNP